MKLPKYLNVKLWSDDGLNIKYKYEDCVSCEECKYWDDHQNGAGACHQSGNPYHWHRTEADDYCSKGELKC